MTETSSTTATNETSTKSGGNSESRSAPIALMKFEEWVSLKKEPKRVKAIRLLVTGRLRVWHVSHDLIQADCRGDSGEIYTLGWRDGLWSCSCPARTDCSHLGALWCVVAVTR